MHVILLALGLAGAVAGAGLIVVNLPIDTALLAQTLLIVGAVVFAGGAVLMGIAATNRQLRRIAQLLEARPQPRAADAPVLSEPPLGLAPLVQAPVVPVPPLKEPVVPSPSVPPAPDPHAETDPAVHPVMLDPAIVEPHAPAPTPPKPEQSAFDAMWASAARAAQRERTPDPADEHHSDVTLPPPKSTPGAGETVTVFKSGVIDGMAYTLYTDGSIEAEMPGGTVRFATVDDLRAYLDEHA